MKNSLYAPNQWLDQDFPHFNCLEYVTVRQPKTICGIFYSKAAVKENIWISSWWYSLPFEDANVWSCQVQLYRVTVSVNDIWWTYHAAITPLLNPLQPLHLPTGWTSLSGLMPDKPFWHGVPVSRADKIPRANCGGGAAGTESSWCYCVAWKGHGSMPWMDALGITINPLSIHLTYCSPPI